MDCEGEPARVAGCTTKSGGQICGDADADGEPSFAGIVLDRRVFLSIRSRFSCWSVGGLCFSPDAGFLHPGVATRHLEDWAGATPFRRNCRHLCTWVRNSGSIQRVPAAYSRKTRIAGSWPFPGAPLSLREWKWALDHGAAVIKRGRIPKYQFRDSRQRYGSRTNGSMRHFFTTVDFSCRAAHFLALSRSLNTRFAEVSLSV